MLLVEQNAAKALEIADYSYVLSTGSVVGAGEARSMLSDASVRSAYLVDRPANDSIHTEKSGSHEPLFCCAKGVVYPSKTMVLDR